MPYLLQGNYWLLEDGSRIPVIAGGDGGGGGGSDQSGSDGPELQGPQMTGGAGGLGALLGPWAGGWVAGQAGAPSALIQQQIAQGLTGQAVDPAAAKAILAWIQANRPDIKQYNPGGYGPTGPNTPYTPGNWYSDAYYIPANPQNPSQQAGYDINFTNISGDPNNPHNWVPESVFVPASQILQYEQGAPPAPTTTATSSGAGDALTQLYNQYFGGGSGSAGTAGTAGASGSTDNLWDKMLAAESSFIPEMLSANYRDTQAGAAAYESAAAPINAKFDDEKRQILDRAAASGIPITSGIIQDQLDTVEQQRTQALSDLERQFNASLPQRQEAGIAQLSTLLGMDQQRQLQSLGIQQALDEATRQRILDAATLAGNQGAAAAENAASQAGSLLGAASSLSNMYYNQAANQAYGQGAAAQGLSGINWGNIFGSSPSYSNPYPYTQSTANALQTYNPQANFDNIYGSMTPGTFGYTGPAAGQ